MFANTKGLCGLLWPNSHDARFDFSTQAIDANDHPAFKKLAKQLDEYFAGSRRQFDVPLDPVGTAFQTDVWSALRKIPYGKTLTYAAQAATIGRPNAARAVGAANGKNPLSIVIPCHRVIGSNGKLTGFAGGIDTKRFLLNHEKNQTKTP